MRDKKSALQIANKVVESRFKDATVAFCSGSYIRDQATNYSDIDLVVLYPKVESAWRESFVFEGWPVEAFVHDPETLRYFICEVDIPSGTPSLPNMLVEGVQVPGDCPTGNLFKELAAELLKKSPLPLSEDQDRNLRYGITDLLDDLRSPRSKGEAIATGARLYEVLADYYFRANTEWSAYGKSIPRRLEAVDSGFAKKFQQCFESLFVTGNGSQVIALASEVLSSFGGLCFDGYKRTAPKNWRTKIQFDSSHNWELTKQILSDGKILSIVQPGPELAPHVVAYVNQVGGESDNLTFGANQFDVTVSDEAELLKKTRESGFNLMIAGIIEGRVVSVANLSRNPRERLKHIGVLGISVRKDFWGRGIARVMIETMITWAKDHGLKKIQLKVKSDNFRAIAIYEKIGFIREGLHPTEVLIDGKYYDHISMGLELGCTT